MDNYPEPEDLESEDNEEEEFDGVVEVIESWERIRTELDNSDVQSPESWTWSTSNSAHKEKVDVWRRVSAEKMRQTLTHRLMRLLEAWVIVGLFVFVLTGNFWLLTTAGLLGLPLQRILDYWFRRPKK